MDTKVSTAAHVPPKAEVSSTFQFTSKPIRLCASSLATFRVQKNGMIRCHTPEKSLSEKLVNMHIDECQPGGTRAAAIDVKEPAGWTLVEFPSKISFRKNDAETIENLNMIQQLLQNLFDAKAFAKDGDLYLLFGDNDFAFTHKLNERPNIDFDAHMNHQWMNKLLMCVNNCCEWQECL